MSTVIRKSFLKYYIICRFFAYFNSSKNRNILINRIKATFVEPVCCLSSSSVFPKPDGEKKGENNELKGVIYYLFPLQFLYFLRRILKDIP